MKRENIKEKIKLIKGSFTDYISENGNVYKLYADYEGFYQKKVSVNRYNGYCYCGITYASGENKSRRVHKLVAEAFISNDDPENKLVVGHKDDNKTNNVYSNLYWTTTQENTQSANNHGLIKQKKGIENKNSISIKVLSLNHELVAVYSSLNDAVSNIKNLEMSYVAKIIKNNGKYKPRNKNYIYVPIDKSEYINTEEKFKNLKLEEKETRKIKQTIFKAFNRNTKEVEICDNQKDFCRRHNLIQSQLSYVLRNNKVYNEWEFEIIGRKNYKDSSIYKKVIDLKPDIAIQNIYTKEILTFSTMIELKKYFNLKGHSIDNNCLILSKWRILDRTQENNIKIKKI